MFETITPEAIKAEILSGLDLWDTSEGSFADICVSGAALRIWQVYQQMNALVPMFYVDESSGAFIDKACSNYGLTRKAGSKATVTLTLTGTTGTTVPAGTTFLTDGNLAFLTGAAVTLSAGSATVAATAAENGVAYNVAAGAVTHAAVSISGVAAVTNTAAAAGGLDDETDAALVKRLYTRLQQPPTSGNAYHYELWALEVSGVGYAKVLPLWNGNGTVKVLLAGQDGGAVQSGVVSAAVTHIEEERPIGATVTVASAAELTVNIAASVTIDGSTNLAAVKSKLTQLVTDYLRSLVFSTYTVNYNRIGYLLLSIPGVVDYASLTVNGTTVNITVGGAQVPVCGTVEVTAT